MRLHGFRIAVRQATRHDKLNPCIGHLPELVFGNAFLKGQEMLERNSLRFIDDLPPKTFLLYPNRLETGKAKYFNSNQ